MKTETGNCDTEGTEGAGDFENKNHMRKIHAFFTTEIETAQTAAVQQCAGTRHAEALRKT